MDSVDGRSESPSLWNRRDIVQSKALYLLILYIWHTTMMLRARPLMRLGKILHWAVNWKGILLHSAVFSSQPPVASILLLEISISPEIEIASKSWDKNRSGVSLHLHDHLQTFSACQLSLPERKTYGINHPLISFKHKKPRQQKSLLLGYKNNIRTQKFKILRSLKWWCYRSWTLHQGSGT